MLTRDAYLKAMGIPIWRLRETGAPHQFYRCLLRQPASDRVIGVLYADRQQPNHDREQALVTAIAKATEQTFSVDIVDDIELSAYPDIRVVLLMSERLAQSRQLLPTLGQQILILTTHTPAALLMNPALKAETWATLKQAIQVMKSA